MSVREDWGARETQLETLHREILFHREAFFNFLYSSNSLTQALTSKSSTTSIHSASDARLRNLKLLKDINKLEEEMTCHIHSTPSPKFVTLQNNYWSMVRSLLPLWEQSLAGDHQLLQHSHHAPGVDRNQEALR